MSTPSVWFRFMVFNATLNNISVISWRSTLLVDETGVPGENHWQTLSHNVVSSTPRHERGFEPTTLVMIGTDCTGSWKSTTMRSLPWRPHKLLEQFQNQISKSSKVAKSIQLTHDCPLTWLGTDTSINSGGVKACFMNTKLPPPFFSEMMRFWLD